VARKIDPCQKSSTKNSPTPSLRQAQGRRRRGHGGSPHPRPRLSGGRLSSRSFDRLRTGLAHELTLRGIRFEQFKRLPVTYKGVLVGDYVADPSATLRTCLAIEDKIIPSTSSGQRLEIKAISQLHPRHEALRQAQDRPRLSTTLRQAQDRSHRHGFPPGHSAQPFGKLRAGFGAESLQHQRIVK